MGCCHSTNAEVLPPPPQPVQTTPINILPNLARSPRNVSNQQPPWTRHHLQRQREIFFETQTAGDPQVWTTLRVVSDHIRQGQMDDAQAIFNAAGLTCPDGNFVRLRHRDPATRRAVTVGGIYDARGKRYLIPHWVVTDPDDLIESDDGRDGVEKSRPDGASIDSSDDEDVRGAGKTGPETQSSGEDKGKEPQQDGGETLRVRARLATEDIYVSLNSQHPVKVLVEKLSEQLSIPRNRLRLMFKGKELKSDLTLEAQTWTKGDTLSVFVTPETY